MLLVLQVGQSDPVPLDEPVVARQRHANPLAPLKLADLLAQRRLRDAQTIGRGSETELLGDRNEVAKVAQLHGTIRYFFRLDLAEQYIGHLNVKSRTCAI